MTAKATGDQSDEAGSTRLVAVLTYWRSIHVILRTLLVVEVAALAGSAIFLLLAPYAGWSLNGTVLDLELFLLAFTILVLTFLTEHSTRRSREDVDRLTQTVVTENRTLIEENRTHWTEQREHLDAVTGSLGQVVELQADLLAAVRQLNATQRAAITLQAQNREARERALQREIEDLKPRLDIRVRGWEGKVFKHFVVSIRNAGAPGADLEVTFELGNTRRSGDSPRVTRGAPSEIDFGDIDGFPDTGPIAVTCDVSSSSKRHRYRYVANYDYSRNRGFWGSSPTVVRKSPQTLPGQVLY